MDRNSWCKTTGPSMCSPPSFTSSCSSSLWVVTAATGSRSLKSNSCMAHRNSLCFSLSRVCGQIIAAAEFLIHRVNTVSSTAEKWPHSCGHRCLEKMTGIDRRVKRAAVGVPLKYVLNSCDPFTEAPVERSVVTARCCEVNVSSEEKCRHWLEQLRDAFFNP